MVYVQPSCRLRARGVYGNGNDSMGVGREWEQESHSRTPLLRAQQHNNTMMAPTADTICGSPGTS